MTPDLPTVTALPAPRALCLALALASLLLVGCGYKGDLALTDPAAEKAEAETGDADPDAKPSAQED